MPLRPHAQRGFTLIELMVAIALLAAMALITWRGLDSITRAQSALSQRADSVLTLQTAFNQWNTDLDALAEQTTQPVRSSLDWDGLVLRVLRRDPDPAARGLVVVAWTMRRIDGQGQWLRWQSPPLRTEGQYQSAWQQASIWAQNPGEQDRKLEVRTAAIDGWQIFYYRGDAWTNPLSSGDFQANASNSPKQAVSQQTGAPAGSLGVGGLGGQAAQSLLPDGVRLVLTLAPGQVLSGTVTRDWLRPTVGGGKS